LTKTSAYANLNTSFKKHKNISKKQNRAAQEKAQGNTMRRSGQQQKQQQGSRTIAPFTIQKRS